MYIYFLNKETQTLGDQGAHHFSRKTYLPLPTTINACCFLERPHCDLNKSFHLKLAFPCTNHKSLRFPDLQFPRV